MKKAINLIKSTIYRKKYQKLLKSLEVLSSKLNLMGAIVEKLPRKAALEIYEILVRAHLDLLEGVERISSFNGSANQLRTSLLLQKRLEKISKLGKKYFLAENDGAFKNFHVLRSQVLGFRSLLGCYFCSRPFCQTGFWNHSLDINAVPCVVPLCGVCKENLGRNKNIKVLYFKLGAIQVHWSEHSSYEPLRDFEKTFRGVIKGLAVKEDSKSFPVDKT